jgi:hypothetical protein
MNSLQKHIIRQTVGVNFIKKVKLPDLPNVLNFIEIIFNYEKMQNKWFKSRLDFNISEMEYFTELRTKLLRKNNLTSKEKDMLKLLNEYWGKLKEANV